MTRLRSQKSAGIGDASPPVEVMGDVDGAERRVLGWGSTGGAIDGAAARARARGRRIATAHLTHLNPFPPNLGAVLARYPRVLVPEINLGQLSRLVRAEYLVDARSVTKVRGVPFTAGALQAAILEMRSEEHTSELQSLMRTSYSVFCLKQNNHQPLRTRSPHSR